MRNICTNQGVVGSRGFDTVLGVHNADGPTWGSFLPILGRSGQSPVLSLTEERKKHFGSILWIFLDPRDVILESSR